MEFIGYNKTKEIQHAIKRFGIKCSVCEKGWMVGDKDRTEEEKKIWVCPEHQDCGCGKCGNEISCEHNMNEAHEKSLCGSCCL